MEQLFSPLRKLTSATAGALLLLPTHALALYSGGGVSAGVGAAGGTGVGSADLGTVIGTIVDEVLSYVALLAVVVVIIAGMYLLLGLGSETSKSTAKKIIIYTGVGLIIILLSKQFVSWIIGLV